MDCGFWAVGGRVVPPCFIGVRVAQAAVENFDMRLLSFGSCILTKGVGELETARRVFSDGRWRLRGRVRERGRAPGGLSATSPVVVSHVHLWVPRYLFRFVISIAFFSRRRVMYVAGTPSYVGSWVNSE